MEEQTNIAVVEPTDADKNLTLVALTPADMAPAQAALAEWCDRKIASLELEFSDLQENHEVMNRAGLSQKGIVPALNRMGKLIAYYEKIKAAVAAGYLIVPNFPIDVFAVRVKRAKQPEGTYESKWGGFVAHPELLPAGTGRYVDDKVEFRDESFTEQIDGKEKHIRQFVTGDYNDVAFPVIAVKPTVLTATTRAMALRIFDEIGTVENRSGRDPIVVGRLIDPRGNRRVTTFFIAWWLNTADL